MSKFLLMAVLFLGALANAADREGYIAGRLQSITPSDYMSEHNKVKMRVCTFYIATPAAAYGEGDQLNVTSYRTFGMVMPYRTECGGEMYKKMVGKRVIVPRKNYKPVTGKEAGDEDLLDSLRDDNPGARFGRADYDDIQLETNLQALVTEYKDIYLPIANGAQKQKFCVAHLDFGNGTLYGVLMDQSLCNTLFKGWKGKRMDVRVSNLAYVTNPRWIAALKKDNGKYFYRQIPSHALSLSGSWSGPVDLPE